MKPGISTTRPSPSPSTHARVGLGGTASMTTPCREQEPRADREPALQPALDDLLQRRGRRPPTPRRGSLVTVSPPATRKALYGAILAGTRGPTHARRPGGCRALAPWPRFLGRKPIGTQTAPSQTRSDQPHPIERARHTWYEPSDVRAQDESGRQRRSCVRA